MKPRQKKTLEKAHHPWKTSVAHFSPTQLGVRKELYAALTLLLSLLQGGVKMPYYLFSMLWILLLSTCIQARHQLVVNTEKEESGTHHSRECWLGHSSAPPPSMEATRPLPIPQDLSCHFPHREMSERGCKWASISLHTCYCFYISKIKVSAQHLYVIYYSSNLGNCLSICFIKVELMQVFFILICTWV